VVAKTYAVIPDKARFVRVVIVQSWRIVRVKEVTRCVTCVTPEMFGMVLVVVIT